MGWSDEKKSRTNRLKIPIVSQQSFILSSASKLKYFATPVFLSQRQSREVDELENKALMMNTKLINEVTRSVGIRVTDGIVHVEEDNVWIKRSGECENQDWPAIYVHILVYNLEQRRRMQIANAIQITNLYPIICLTETWLPESISNIAIFLPNLKFFWKHRPSEKGLSKHGGTLIAVTNILNCEIWSGLRHCPTLDVDSFAHMLILQSSQKQYFFGGINSRWRPVFTFLNKGNRNSKSLSSYFLET